MAHITFGRMDHDVVDEIPTALRSLVGRRQPAHLFCMRAGLGKFSTAVVQQAVVSRMRIAPGSVQCRDLARNRCMSGRGLTRALKSWFGSLPNPCCRNRPVRRSVRPGKPVRCRASGVSSATTLTMGLPARAMMNGSPLAAASTRREMRPGFAHVDDAHEMDSLNPELNLPNLTCSWTLRNDFGGSDQGHAQGGSPSGRFRGRRGNASSSSVAHSRPRGHGRAIPCPYP